MTKAEMDQIRGNMIAFINSQVSLNEFKIECLTNGNNKKLEKELGINVEEELKQVKHKYSLLKQFQAQTKVVKTPEELKVIHDELAKLLEVKNPNSNF